MDSNKTTSEAINEARSELIGRKSAYAPTKESPSWFIFHPFGMLKTYDGRVFTEEGKDITEKLKSWVESFNS